MKLTCGINNKAYRTLFTGGVSLNTVDNIMVVDGSYTNIFGDDYSSIWLLKYSDITENRPEFVISILDTTGQIRTRWL